MANLLTDSKGRVFIDRDGVLFRSSDDDDSDDGDVDEVDCSNDDNVRSHCSQCSPARKGNL